MRQIAMADWRLLRHHRMVSGFYTLRHDMLAEAYLGFRNFDQASRLAWVAREDINLQSVLVYFHRHEVHLVRTSRIAIEQLLKYREHRCANQSQSAPGRAAQT